ncbi:hypothetical protein [Streptomyces niger]|uniref:hypothetical protein n=1 Tax=Streptomyces niger TaxID=66373 RepID=UPI00069B31BB|nr:hypothetical protein [Streptomyces niger]
MLTSTVCAALSVAGLGIAALAAFRRRFLAATRIAAFALIPAGLVMTGIIDWITGLVLKPTVWAGFGLLALSVLLFLVSRFAERRSGRRTERRAAAAAQPGSAVAPAASAPSLGAGREPGRRPAAEPARQGGADDFSDIEAILKKHGI